MAHTYIQIGSQTYDAAAFTMPGTGRLFREAWTTDGDVIEIDMVQARAIHRDRLRTERNPRLTALDAEWFRAAEDGDATKQADVAASKQALRDVTDDPRIDAAATAEALAALTLDALLA